MSGFYRPSQRDEQRMRRFMSINGVGIIAPPATGTILFTGDGTSLAGWTNTGFSVSGKYTGPSGSKASRQVVGAKRWKIDMKAVSPGSLVDFQFGCNSSGVGPMFRIDTRAGNFSGLGTSSGFGAFATAPTGANSIGTSVNNVVYTVEIIANAALTTVTVYVNGALLLNTIPVTINGDYICFVSEIGANEFDNIIVSSS